MVLDDFVRFNRILYFFPQNKAVILYVRFGWLNKNKAENKFSVKKKKIIFYLILLIV